MTDSAPVGTYYAPSARLKFLDRVLLADKKWGVIRRKKRRITLQYLFNQGILFKGSVKKVSYLAPMPALRMLEVVVQRQIPLIELGRDQIRCIRAVDGQIEYRKV